MVRGEYRFGERQTYGPLEMPEGVDSSEWALGAFVGMTHDEMARHCLYAGMEPNAYAALLAEQKREGRRVTREDDLRPGKPLALTAAQVWAARDRYLRGEATQGQLAREYGVSRFTVNRAVNRVGGYSEVA